MVGSALPFRAAAVPFASVAAHWSVIVNMLVGSLLGAWFGAGWATKLASQTLYRVIAIMLVLIAVVLVLGHDRVTSVAVLIGLRNWSLAWWRVSSLALWLLCLAWPAASC